MGFKVELNLSPKGINNESNFKMLHELIDIREKILYELGFDKNGYNEYTSPALRIFYDNNGCFFTFCNGVKNEIGLDTVCDLLNKSTNDIFYNIITHRNDSDFYKHLFEEYIVKKLLPF